MTVLRAVTAAYSGSTTGWLPSKAVANYIVPSTCTQESMGQVRLRSPSLPKFSCRGVSNHMLKSMCIYQLLIHILENLICECVRPGRESATAVHPMALYVVDSVLLMCVSCCQRMHHN